MKKKILSILLAVSILAVPVLGSANTVKEPLLSQITNQGISYESETNDSKYSRKLIEQIKEGLINRDEKISLKVDGEYIFKANSWREMENTQDGEDFSKLFDFKMTLAIAKDEIFSDGKDKYPDIPLNYDLNIVYENDMCCLSEIIPHYGTEFEHENLYNDVLDMIKKRENVDLSEYKIDPCAGNEIILYSTYHKVVEENPELFYAFENVGIRINSRQEHDYDEEGNITNVKFLSKYTSIIPSYMSVTDEDIKAFNDKADSVINTVIKDGMSDVEKALVLHDWVINNSKYGYKVNKSLSYPERMVDGEEDSIIISPYKTNTMLEIENEDNEFKIDLQKSHTAYGVFMQGVGVCQSYARAYKVLLDRVGIESKIVSSDEMSHEWSVIKLDDEWYHVDSTWDDPVIFIDEESIEQDVSVVGHEYFLLSDKKIGEVREKEYHHDWKVDVKCTSEKYDGEYAFRYVKDYAFGGPTYYYNGELYTSQTILYSGGTEKTLYFKYKIDDVICKEITKETFDLALQGKGQDGDIPKLPSSDDIKMKAKGIEMSEVTVDNINEMDLVFENTSKKDIDIDVWLAYYNEGVLVGCNKASVGVKVSNKESEIELPTVQASEFDSIQIMFWDGNSIDGIRPLMNSFKLTRR